MTEEIDRDEIIDLLEQLGGERDEEVLTAARKLHERVTSARVTWDELLEPDEDHDYGGEVADEDEPEDEAPESRAESAEQDAQSLALIDKLLARPGISDEFRRELEDYKDDIAEGDFAASDHRYVQALHKRLSKQG